MNFTLEGSGSRKRKSPVTPDAVVKREIGSPKLGIHLVGSGPGAETRFGGHSPVGRYLSCFAVLDLSLQGGPLQYNRLLGNGI